MFFRFLFLFPFICLYSTCDENDQRNILCASFISLFLSCRFLFQVENGASAGNAAASIHPTMTNSNRSSNRFSNDFSTLDVHLVSTSSDATNNNNNNNTPRWKCGNAASDLHSSHSTFNQTVLCYNSTAIASSPSSDAVTATTSSTSTAIDAASTAPSTGHCVATSMVQQRSHHLPGCDDVRQFSKPHASSSHDSNRARSPFNSVAVHGATRTNNGEGEQASAANEITSANVLVPKHAPLSRDRLFNANVSSTAHAFFDFLKFKRNSESNNSGKQQQQQARFGPSSVSELERCHDNLVNSSAVGGAMRLNVPAATATATIDATVNTDSETSFGSINTNSPNASKQTCSAVSCNMNKNLIVDGTRSTGNVVTTMSNHILENGTLMGAIVSQPSLTIHVNHPNSIEQGPRTTAAAATTNSSHQMQNVVNQSAGGVSIVNCYRGVPVQIVNTTSASELNANANANNVQIANNMNMNIHASSKVGRISAVNEKNRNEKCDIECNGNNNNDLVSVNAIDVVALDTQNALNTSIISNASHQSRTFTSTEAQTDDLQQTDTALIHHSSPNSNPIQVVPATTSLASNSAKQNEGTRRSGGSNGATASDIETITSREQRRRERRERRQARNARQQHMHPSMHSGHSNCEILPDILHSHVPPPYTTLPMPPHCPINAVATASPPPSVLVPGPPSALITPIPVGISDDGRYTFPLPIMRR